jgi:glyoxylase-like metal-dependent hydrolase (beta-lactamase superfamily II)
MILDCLGSNSSGNSYLIHDDSECLVIEAGVNMSESKKALDFNIDKIRGVIISHGHL